MSRSVKFYYGLSGAFKATTIKNNLKPGDSVMWSGIKKWKHWERNFIYNQNDPNDLNFALLHLFRLSELNYSIDKDETILHIERGVTDMLFYWLLTHHAEDQETIIKNLVEEELRVSKIAAGDIKEPEKILLVQRDYDFVRDVVLKEETRSERFETGIQDYIKAQDQYIDFTKRYNNITSEVIITDAREYLESLGIEWKNS